MAQKTLEIEWQFDADDLDAVEAWLREHRSISGLSVVPGRTREIADTYYDTEDWRFYRAGYALRVRRTGRSVEATIKALSPAQDGVRRRIEISEPLRSSTVTALQKARGPVGERLRRLTGTRKVHPLFSSSTRRRVFELRLDGEGSHIEGDSGEVVTGPMGDIRRKETGTSSPEGVEVDALGGIHRRGVPAGEVALDRTEFSGEGRIAHLSRVEVEAAEEGELYERVDAFVEGLRGSLGLSPTETSKFRTGLANAGLHPPGELDFGPTAVDASLSAGDAAFAVLRQHFVAMLAHEPGVRLGESAEELHDMRVASRRLRAALKLYADALPKRAERFERDLRWVAGALGEVRDLDVHLERLVEEAPEDEVGKAAERIAAILGERREEAHRHMLEVLDSARYERLVSGLAGMLRRGRSPEPTGPILAAAPRLLRRRYKKVKKIADGLSRNSPPEDFHELRKKGKQLRYALEPLQEIYGKPADKMVELLKALQDDLGEHQDLAVAARLMRELALAGDLPPQTVFCMGWMAGRDAGEAASIRAALPDSKGLDALGKRWKKLQKALNERSGE